MNSLGEVAIIHRKGRNVPVLAGPSMSSSHSLNSYMEGKELPDMQAAA